jgi:hypothetical protein
MTSQQQKAKQSYYISLSQTHTDTHTTGQKQLKIPTAATATTKKA